MGNRGALVKREGSGGLLQAVRSWEDFGEGQAWRPGWWREGCELHHGSPRAEMQAKKRRATKMSPPWNR